MVDLTDRLDLWEPRDHVTRPPWEAVKMIVINTLSTLSFLQLSILIKLYITCICMFNILLKLNIFLPKNIWIHVQSFTHACNVGSSICFVSDQFLSYCVCT